MVFNCLSVNLYFSRASLGLDNEPGSNCEQKYLKGGKPPSRALVTPVPPSPPPQALGWEADWPRGYELLLRFSRTPGKGKLCGFGEKPRGSLAQT